MSEWEDKLGQILGNPQAMEQIMSLAQSLGGTSGGAQGEGAATPASPPPPPAQPAPSSLPAGGLLDGLRSLDPNLLAGAASLLGQVQGGGEDDRAALLQALRPFVKPERYAKLDQAIQIARLSRLIRTGLALLRPREEGEGQHHV